VPPFGIKAKGPKIIQLVASGSKPQRSDHPRIEEYTRSDELWSLFEECWDTDPTIRPSAEQVVQRLGPVLRELAKKNDNTEQRPVQPSYTKGPASAELGRADMPVKSGDQSTAPVSVPGQISLGKAEQRVVRAKTPPPPE
jgi:hypothetical protein